MTTSWIDLFGAAVSGGVVVKILDFVFEEYRQRSHERRTAGDLIDRHLDPILKAGDELVGKLRSMAQSDFREILRAGPSISNELNVTAQNLDVMFLFAQFWARVQLLRLESLYVNLGTQKAGIQLLKFLGTLEATRTRLVDRAWQRGIGEALIEHTDSGPRSLSYYEFVGKYLDSAQYRQWLQPLLSILENVNHTRLRQRVLVYGVILHAMTDALDEKHTTSRHRDGWANKLSRKSRRDLQYRVFRVYLPFVKRPQRYFAIPKNKSARGALAPQGSDTLVGRLLSVLRGAMHPRPE